MATGADVLRAAALHEVGEPYVWGKEGVGGIEGPDPYDCSGFAHTMWELGGYPNARMTANDYYRKSSRISGPTQVGDAFVMLDGTGHATHIGLYVGCNETVEARGSKYGVVKYHLEDPMNGVTHRRGVWIRMPGMNLGVLTGQPVSLPPIVKPTVMPQVSKGSKGSAVVTLQKALIAKGFSCGKWGADGDFGSATKAAVVRFQKKMWPRNSKEWDGVVGPKTWAKLGFGG